MKRDVIIACDFKSAGDTFRFLDLFRDEERKPFLKVGMELFYAEGPGIVRTIKAQGHKVFLDLKLHDIPNTVKKAMAVLSRLDVDMCNVHAAGTIEMMKDAAELSSLLLLSVTLRVIDCASLMSTSPTTNRASVRTMVSPAPLANDTKKFWIACKKSFIIAPFRAPRAAPPKGG